MKSQGCQHCRNQITPTYCSMGRNMTKGDECKLFKPKLPKPKIKPEIKIIPQPVREIHIEDYKPCRRCDYKNHHPHYNQPCPKQDINGHSCFNSKIRRGIV